MWESGHAPACAGARRVSCGWESSLTHIVRLVVWPFRVPPMPKCLEPVRFASTPRLMAVSMLQQSHVGHASSRIIPLYGVVHVRRQLALIRRQEELVKNAVAVIRGALDNIKDNPIMGISVMARASLCVTLAAGGLGHVYPGGVQRFVACYRCRSAICRAMHGANAFRIAPAQCAVQGARVRST